MTFFLPTSTTNKEDVEYRLNIINEINMRIFHLTYYSNFTYQDCENMTSVELKWFYKKLVETKDAEDKIRKDTLGDSSSKSSSSNNSYRKPNKRRRR